MILIRKKVCKIFWTEAFFVFFLLFITPEAFGQDLKIGYVDPLVIIDRMPEAKAVQQRIQNLYERKQNELLEKRQELQTALELYQQKVGVISEEARVEEEERLTTMDQEFQQMQSEVQQELQQQRIDLMEPLLEQIQMSVNNIADQEGFDLVLNINTAGYGILDRTIIQISPEYRSEYNFTQKVIEDLGL